MAALDRLKTKAISVAANKAIDLIYEDFDDNLPKIRSAINALAGLGDATSEEQLALFNMVMDYL